MAEFIGIHHIELALLEIKIKKIKFLTMDTLFLYSNHKGNHWLNKILPISKYLGLLGVFVFLFLKLVS